MFGIIMAMVGMVAAGALIAYTIVVTIKWLKNKVKEKLAKKNVKKVVACDLEKLINECENKVSMSDLEKYVDDGYTNLLAEVDSNGKVTDVELVKNENLTTDEEVEKLIGEKGMVVITE